MRGQKKVVLPKNLRDPKGREFWTLPHPKQDFETCSVCTYSNISTCRSETGMEIMSLIMPFSSRLFQIIERIAENQTSMCRETAGDL